MKLIPRFLKATIVGGLLFMVPIILMIVVLQKGVGMLRKVVVPLAAPFPYHKIAGVGVATILAVVLIAVVSFVLGLAAQTSTGRRFRERLEWTILGKVPGYAMLKVMLPNVLSPNSR